MIFGWLFGGRKRRKESWQAERRYCLLRLEVPKNNEKTPLAAEQMFAALHGIYQHQVEFQDNLSFEIVSQNNSIQFYVYTPAHLKNYVEGQIYAQYPTVEITEVGDYVHFDPSSGLHAALSEIETTKPDVFPIKTFLNFNVDPLAGITGVLGHSVSNEEISIQLVVEPVSDEWQSRGVSYVNAIRAGQDPSLQLSNLLARGAVGLAGEILKTAASPAASSAPAKTDTGKTVELSGPRQIALKGIEEKVTKLGFRTKIRVLVISNDRNQANAKLSAVIGSFKQFNTTNLNGLASGRRLAGEQAVEQYRSRYLGDKGYVFNIEELASVFHLPNVSVETPTILWAGSKKGEPPANLPLIGNTGDGEVTVFAQTNFRHMVQPFGMKQRDRGLHMYAIGKTGTGKSTMLENMIIDDIAKGRGVAVVDPHGDLIKKIVRFIPNRRINEVILFDPSDRDFPVAFNPLENVDPDLKNVVASGVVGIFKKIFGESWGPRLEYILRNTILALLDYPDATMLGITRVLTDPKFRREVVEKIKDPVIHDFFVNEYEKYDQKFRVEAIAPIQNKVGQFLSTTTIRNIVGQPKSTIDIREAMDKSKIILLDLAVGKIGEDNSALLGAMMITKIQLAAMGRAEIPESERTNFYLYVDEFQNFATDSFAIILSEARKYHLNITMTNQYIAQMPETVSSAVFGNVGTIISFRVGASDATALAREFEPVFTPNDLVNLDNFNIYVKMAIDGVTSTPFSALTLPPRDNPNDNYDKILAISREHYARSRAEVERKIADWSDFDQKEPAVKPTLADKKTEPLARRLAEIDINNKDIQIVKSSQGKKWYIVSHKKKDPETKQGSEQSSKSLSGSGEIKPGETIVLKDK